MHDDLKYTGSLPDGGPVYAETNFHYIIMEPWNAVSSLAFLIPVVYYFNRLKGRYSEYPFLSVCMVLLFLGGLGSTFFHAFRISPYLLMLDVLPIQILTLLVSIYFWVKVLRRWYYIFFALAPFVFLRFGLLYSMGLSRFAAINIAYFITGVMIFLPALILLLKSRFQNANFLIGGMFLFMISLAFRHSDAFPISFLPMGTHWLWHVFGAAGSALLGEYLYRVNNLSLYKYRDTAKDPDRKNSGQGI